MPDQAKALYLTDTQLAAIMQHINKNVFVEVCGMLGGVGGVVKAIYPIPNIAAHPESAFQMEPISQVHAMIEIDKQGLEVIAIYHSHPPGSRTDPSDTDLRKTTYPDAYSLIIMPSDGSTSGSLRAFVTRENRAVEVPIVINLDYKADQD